MKGKLQKILWDGFDQEFDQLSVRGIKQKELEAEELLRQMEETKAAARKDLKRLDRNTIKQCLIKIGLINWRTQKQQTSCCCNKKWRIK